MTQIYRSLPRRGVGVCLLSAGLLAVSASFLTWQSFALGAARFSGVDDGDGWFSFWLGVVLAAAGLFVAVWHAARWALVVALTQSIGLAALFRLDQVDVGRDAGSHIGPGLWLVAAAALLGAAASAWGLMGRFGLTTWTS